MAPELAVDLRQVGGAFSVDENARRLIHYRYAEIACMEAEGGWVATMAAPKLKITLADHAYQCSLHADAIGRRLPELRITENIDMTVPPTMRVADVRRPPNDEFARFIREMQDQDDELLRLAGLYRVLKPHLAVYYRHHMAVTDQISDEEEQIRWGQAIYEELADTAARRRKSMEWQTHLEELLATSGGVTGGK
jgi:hypothetical protein